jgi:hypothetical protein
MNTHQRRSLIAAVVVLGTGKLFAVCGQSIFSLSFAYQLVANNTDCNLSNTQIDVTEPEYPVIILGTLSTLWVRGITRYPSLWRTFKLNENEQDQATQKSDPPLFPRDDKTKLTVSVLTFINGLVSGSGVGIQAYLGTQVILRLLGVTNSLALIIIPAVNSLCSLATFFSFIMSIVILNAQKLVGTCRDFRCSKSEVKRVSWPMVGTFALCILGNFAYAASAFFFASDTFRDMFYLRNESVNQGLSWLVFACTFISVFLSRVAKTYQFLATDHKKTFFTLFPKLNAKTFSLLLGHVALCFLDIMTYAFSFYSGAVDVLMHLSLTCNNPAAITLAALTALSGGYMHFIFSVESQLKRDGKNLIKASENSESCLFTREPVRNKALSVQLDPDGQTEAGQVTNQHQFAEIGGVNNRTSL